MGQALVSSQKRYEEAKNITSPQIHPSVYLLPHTYTHTPHAHAQAHLPVIPKFILYGTAMWHTDDRSRCPSGNGPTLQRGDFDHSGHCCSCIFIPIPSHTSTPCCIQWSHACCIFTTAVPWSCVHCPIAPLSRRLLLVFSQGPGAYLGTYLGSGPGLFGSLGSDDGAGLRLWLSPTLFPVSPVPRKKQIQSSFFFPLPHHPLSLPDCLSGVVSIVLLLFPFPSNGSQRVGPSLATPRFASVSFSVCCTAWALFSHLGRRRRHCILSPSFSSHSLTFVSPFSSN